MLNGVTVGGLRVPGVDEVRTNVVLDDLGEQTIERPSAARQEVHDFRAVGLRFERGFNGLDLPADPANAIHELLLCVNGVRHAPLSQKGWEIP